jgi:hypothetical protein
MRPRSHESSQPTKDRLLAAATASTVGALLLAGCGGSNEPTGEMQLYATCAVPDAEVIIDDVATSPFEAAAINTVQLHCLDNSGNVTGVNIRAATGFDGASQGPENIPKGAEPTAIISVPYDDAGGSDGFESQIFAGRSYVRVNEDRDGSFATERIAFQGVDVIDELTVAPYQQ